MKKEQKNGIYLIAFILASLSLITAPSFANTASLTRGPYLQMGSHNSMTVRWRTDKPSKSQVRFGLAPGSLNQSIKSNTETTEHIVTLSELNPLTRYYYSVGSDTQVIAGDDNTTFLKPLQSRAKLCQQKFGSLATQGEQAMIQQILGRKEFEMVTKLTQTVPTQTYS